jgi:hypothetical protein
LIMRRDGTGGRSYDEAEIRLVQNVAGELVTQWCSTAPAEIAPPPGVCRPRASAGAPTVALMAGALSV